MNTNIAFGPVPSRRLGQSLGINNIPPKICTYSCVYCQLGLTSQLQVQRREFYNPDIILSAVEEKVDTLAARGKSLDYLSFVPDGEPTLDINLGREIKLLGKNIDTPVAVITNSSLIWREDVRQDLYGADLVSFKVDAVSEEDWRKIDRPHGSLRLENILTGIVAFSSDFGGRLITETMLIEGVNDSPSTLEAIADYISTIDPDAAYLSVPIRPPAEKGVKIPDSGVLNTAYQIFKERLKKVEYLVNYEGTEFSATGDVQRDLLSITSVHPMRQEAIEDFLRKTGSDWSLLEELLLRGEIKEIEYRGKRFYARNLRNLANRP